MTIFVTQGDSSLLDVPTCKRCALRHSGGWSDGSLSEILCAESHRQDRREGRLWRGAEVLCPAALDLSVDQRQYAAHSARRYTAVRWIKHSDVKFMFITHLQQICFRKMSETEATILIYLLVHPRAQQTFTPTKFVLESEPYWRDYIPYHN